MFLYETLGVLVVGGNTHNFIKDIVASTLGITLEPIDPFCVLVVNGQELLCYHIFHWVSINLQGHSFFIDLFVLGLRGADIVLEAKWLKRLGPILMNYNLLIMTFFHNNACVELKGYPPYSLCGLSSIS